MIVLVAVAVEGGGRRCQLSLSLAFFVVLCSTKSTKKKNRQHAALTLLLACLWGSKRSIILHLLCQPFQRVANMLAG